MKIPADNAPDFDIKTHWEQVYAEKNPTEVSWYQQHPERSLELIRATGVDLAAACIDIGGGASTLVDAMLDAGYCNITVLDIAHAAIEQAKTRLAGRASTVTWIEQDITEFRVESVFDVWHDRAVFHFLTDPLDRSSYVHAMTRALKPGAHAIIATFALDGPEKCSGLEVVRYSPESLSAVLGDSYELVDSCTESHLTPNAATQSFVYCRFKKCF
ncbi:MAG: class I SAM-dependent methyltransferase [Gammaproteobacteria bacterium]